MGALKSFGKVGKIPKETIARTARCGGSVSPVTELPEKSELVYAVGENRAGLRNSATHFVAPGPTPELSRSLLGMESFKPHPGSTEPECQRGSSWPLSAKVEV